MMTTTDRPPAPAAGPSSIPPRPRARRSKSQETWLDDVSRRAARIDPMEKWSQSMKETVESVGENERDEGFLRALVPLMEVLGKYFDSEVRGMEKIPKDRPVLLVGNHSGGVLTPDTSAVIAAWYRAQGFDRALVGLALDAAFSVPGFGTLLRKLGFVPGRHRAAANALRRGDSVLVYPGGAHEVFRPFSDRERIDFGGHKGFLRLALETGATIVPMVGHGGHHTTIVLTRGERLAKALGMDRLRLSAYPILLQFPWGLTNAAMQGIPFPAKIVVQVLDPIETKHLDVSAAKDPATIDRLYDEIVAKMQSTLDALVAEHPHPWLSRLESLVRGR